MSLDYDKLARELDRLHQPHPVADLDPPPRDKTPPAPPTPMGVKLAVMLGTAAASVGGSWLMSVPLVVAFNFAFVVRIGGGL